MLLRSPKLGACAISIVPLVAVVNKYYGNWLSENAARVQDALAAANSVAQETLACIRTVVAFASEESEYDKYKERIDEQYRLNIRQTYIQGVYYMVREFGKRKEVVKCCHEKSNSFPLRSVRFHISDQYNRPGYTFVGGIVYDTTGNTDE